LEGAETDVEEMKIGMVYIVDREKMVSKYFYFFVFIVFNFCYCFIVCAMLRDKVGVRMSSAVRCYEVSEMCEGEARVSLGEGKASEYGSKGGEEERSN
jgi:hypothetical protein